MPDKHNEVLTKALCALCAPQMGVVMSLSDNVASN